jgi:hypothetical protein
VYRLWIAKLGRRLPNIGHSMPDAQTTILAPLLYGCCNLTKSKGSFSSSKFVDVGLPATYARSKRLLAHLSQLPEEKVLQCTLNRVPWASHGDATALTGALVIRTTYMSLMRGAARFETPRRGRKGRKRPRIQRPVDPKKACGSSWSLASWAGGRADVPERVFGLPDRKICNWGRACSTYALQSSRHDRYENTEGLMSW